MFISIFFVNDRYVFSKKMFSEEILGLTALKDKI